jgi:hypothetical protein
MTTNSWDFMKGQSNIRVVRRQGRALVITSPGVLSEHYQFGDEAAMQSYQIQLAEQLTETGWLLTEC